MKKVNVILVILLLCSFASVVVGVAMIGTNNGKTQNEEVDETARLMADAESYFETDNFMQAIAVYEELLEGDGDKELILPKMAVNYHELEKYEKELEIRKELFEEYPDVSENWEPYINVLIKQEQYDEAKTVVDEALKIESGNEMLKDFYNRMNLESPTFDIPAGAYPDYQLIVLTNPSDYGTVYYTLDGSDPIENGKVYRDGVVISAPQTEFKAVAKNSLGYNSEVTVSNYTITKEVEKVSSGGWNYPSIYDYLCDELGKSELYNYDFAQVRELYVIGYHVAFERPSVSYTGEDYEYGSKGSSYYADNYRGNVNLSTIKYMPFLSTLSVGFQGKISLDDLSGHRYLENFSAINCNIKDISFINGCTNLKTFAIGWNEVSDISPLASCSELTSVGLWNNQISDVSALRSLSKLEYFDVSHNQVNDISVINSMDNLNEIWVNDNQISDFSPIDHCANLNVLMVGKNSSSNYGSWSAKADQLAKTDMK